MTLEATIESVTAGLDALRVSMNAGAAADSALAVQALQVAATLALAREVRLLTEMVRKT